jgi:hypothetical protein
MLRFALILAALMLAGAPAALGLMQNASFTPETPVRIHERSTEMPPELERPDPGIDERTTAKEHRDSRLTERRQAHNERDDRPAHRPRPTP